MVFQLKTIKTVNGIVIEIIKWDFVFQSYHLIAHLSVIENVELALTLSGYNKQARREKAINVLKKGWLRRPVK